MVGHCVVAGVAIDKGESALGVNINHALAAERLDRHGVYVGGGVSATTDSTVLGRPVVGFKF